MALHLVHSWWDLGCLEQTLRLCDGEIRDANCLDQSLFHQLLHALSRRCVCVCGGGGGGGGGTAAKLHDVYHTPT